MQFASFAYLLSLGAVAVAYFALPGPRSRTLLLLAASLAFYYSLSPLWTWVLLLVIAVGYVGGDVISRAREGRARRTLTAVFVALVVAILGVFKYARFSALVWAKGLTAVGFAHAQPLRLALPIGISFWTFMTISYLVDVGRGHQRAERNLVRYALFISFFPHVTAGPIGSAPGLLPQFAKKHRFSYDKMQSGLLLIGWGFLKKLLVADPLGVVVQTVYHQPHRYTGTHNGLVLGIASIAFAVQIYCDFSGYTDIVRGSARLFGVDLLPNFDRPYFARSVKEFWRRWHMSLMQWFKRYVYIPLGGSRVPKWRRYLNILAVFLLSGIWHGAGITFVVWGLLNGAYQIVGELTAPLRSAVVRVVGLTPDGRLHRLGQIVATFLLITVAWVFFRAESLADALYILPRMFVPTLHVLTDGSLTKLGLTPQEGWAVFVAAVLVFAVEYAAMRAPLLAIVKRQPLPVRWTGYLALILVVAVFGYYGSAYNAAGFAYFKF